VGSTLRGVVAELEALPLPWALQALGAAPTPPSPPQARARLAGRPLPGDPQPPLPLPPAGVDLATLAAAHESVVLDGVGLARALGEIHAQLRALSARVEAADVAAAAASPFADEDGDDVPASAAPVLPPSEVVRRAVLASSFGAAQRNGRAPSPDGHRAQAVRR
jgi:hypothetical protein